MELLLVPFTVHKRHALRISRGSQAASVNLWLRLRQDGIEGWGEASSFSTAGTQQTAAELQAILAKLAPALKGYGPWDRQAIEQFLIAQRVPSGVRTAVDLALHDWMGKRLGLPLWKLWGLDRDRIPPVSVTIGISSPAAAQERLRSWQQLTPVQVIKIKLGSPEGMAADQAMFAAVQAIAPTQARIYVDANGGWDLEGAIAMAHWLADRGVEYLEQPLAEGNEAQLPSLKAQSPLPLFVDESCWGLADIPKLAAAVDGINIKLMKCGGLGEARRMVETAKACGLKVMFGCYSDSALLNSAAAQLGPLADYLDLDSHLNLRDDPFRGAAMIAGRLVPNDLPGLGVEQVVSQVAKVDTGGDTGGDADAA